MVDAIEGEQEDLIDQIPEEQKVLHEIGSPGLEGKRWIPGIWRVAYAGPATEHG